LLQHHEKAVDSKSRRDFPRNHGAKPAPMPAGDRSRGQRPLFGRYL